MTDAVIDSKVKDLNGKRNQKHTFPKRAGIGIEQELIQLFKEFVMLRLAS